MIIASNPYEGLGQVISNGHCMRHVQECHGVPHSSALRRGARVGPDTPPGAIIATFDAAGRYANRTDGSSHIAVLLNYNDDGSINVVDQWKGQPVHERVIRDKGGVGTANNDASRFHVVETA
jgi:hypothetical protein